MHKQMPYINDLIQYYFYLFPFTGYTEKHFLLSL